MQKQLTALPVDSIITEWQQACSFLYRKYCFIPYMRKENSYMWSLHVSGLLLASSH